MKQRALYFRAFFKDLKIILTGFSLQPSGSIGMDFDDFTDSLGDAYDVEDGEIRTVLQEDGVTGGELVSTYLEGEDYIWLEENQIIVSQYSGVNDESGTDIFEHDRIEEEGLKGNVIFQAGAFMIDWDTEDVLCDPIGFDKQNRARTLTVIGHSFEPPRLLNTNL